MSDCKLCLVHFGASCSRPCPLEYFFGRDNMSDLELLIDTIGATQVRESLKNLSRLEGYKWLYDNLKIGLAKSVELYPQSVGAHDRSIDMYELSGGTMPYKTLMGDFFGLIKKDYNRKKLLSNHILGNFDDEEDSNEDDGA